jgi:hypothetical protein
MARTNANALSIIVMISIILRWWLLSPRDVKIDDVVYDNKKTTLLGICFLSEVFGEAVMG